MVWRQISVVFGGTPKSFVALAKRATEIAMLALMYRQHCPLLLWFEHKEVASVKFEAVKSKGQSAKEGLAILDHKITFIIHYLMLKLTTITF